MSSLLVIDALEKFEGEARSRAIELLRTLCESGFAGWNVVISGHLQSWEKAQRLLQEAGATDFVKSDLELPSISAIRSAVHNVPGISLLLFRPELQQILRNLTGARLGFEGQPCPELVERTRKTNRRDRSDQPDLGALDWERSKAPARQTPS